MVRRQQDCRPLTKLERARKVCVGLLLTSLWLGVNSVAWWAVREMRERVSLVDDYGEGLAMPEEGLEWWQPPEEDAAMYASDDEGAFEWVEAVVA